MEKPNIVQLNNQYINDENMKKRYEEEETRRRHRFIGWILVFIILLFILPAYNLVASYISLQNKQAQIVRLHKQQKRLDAKTESEKRFAERLKNDTFVEKYARAKYYYSIDGETIYPAPNLLPK
ncbi:FtsB family cell division protein [Streptococcus macacae]|uniref:Septum formation initiator n=1 Tax=Streptococcus macacae NCTC 11558 TaxID=764298 RepID=G5JXK7_9STRE|nr:septum formation initiator family protein [Streptococcus macacae]EHJ52879.1 septum formation initiator [Streptococcus macacae NCTC 11558]SUN77567.1 cell division protein DivIC [Streptococcus macacae NCTC 11558]